MTTLIHVGAPARARARAGAHVNPKPSQPPRKVKVKVKAKIKTSIDFTEMRAIAVSTNSNAVEACQALHRRVGGNFILRFKRRLVPMVMRRGEVGGRVYFAFQIAYVVDETTAFPGMQIFVGATSNSLHSSQHGGPATHNEAHIGLIHALPLHRWKGSDMIELALGIARAMGVTRASLRDATYHTCERTKGQTKGQDQDPIDPEVAENRGAHRQYRGYDLSMIMLLSRNVTFYGRYGFLPVASSVWDVSNLNTGDPKADVCATLAKLKHASASSFKRYLRAMLHHLDRPQPTAGHRFITHSHGFGVLQIYVQPLAAALASIPARVMLMKRLLTSFRPHEGPFLPLFGDGSDSGTDKTLSCSAKSDMLALLEIGFPILQIHQASGSPRERQKKTKTQIQWPAWRAIEQVSRIRNMSMEAIIHQDPNMQRVKTFCPSLGPSIS